MVLYSYIKGNRELQTLIAQVLLSPIFLSELSETRCECNLLSTCVHNAVHVFDEMHYNASLDIICMHKSGATIKVCIHHDLNI